MRSRFRSLVALAAALTGLLLAELSAAPPKPRTAKPPKKPSTHKSSPTSRNAAAVRATAMRAAGATRSAAIARAPGQSAAAGVRIPTVQGLIPHRRAGQTAYAVQVRAPGWHKSVPTTPAAAAASRAQLRSQGFSAHTHDLGSRGTYVHYSMSHWRPYALYNNGHAANSIAAALRANGLSARVVQR